MHAATNQKLESTVTAIGGKFPLGGVHETGTYVCNWSGHLLRMSEGGQGWGGSPFFNIVAKEPLFITKISNDPFVTLSKAREIASSLDVPVNF